MGRVIRRIIVRTVRYFVLRPVAAVGSLVMLVALVAAAVILPGALGGGNLPGLNLNVGLPRSSGDEPQATASYLRGNRNYDASLMWNALDDAARQRFQERGGSLEDLQRQMQVAQQSGVTLEDVSYIGGKALPDGTSMEFYLVAVKQPSQSNADYVPYLFTLDRDGKIARVQ